ncbi:hypothetical protein SK128_007779 [Halocaridina rubra]|uniref:Uncharacterized protein n=1 Tax=Halocaridina rubra TaxID=373956 RepID=A0AAN8XKB6_HALRR
MCSRLVGDVGVYFDDRFTSAVRFDLAPCKDHTSSAITVDQLNNTLCEKPQGKMSSLSGKELWNYVQWLLGIHHDDCDYVDLNKRLGLQLRDFVKTACCYPERLVDTNPTTTTTSCVQTSMVSRLFASLLALLLSCTSYK